MKSKSRNYLFLLSLFVLPALTSCGFVHPGLLHTQADFDRMKAKVDAKISPWIDGYSKTTSVVNLGYGHEPSYGFSVAQSIVVVTMVCSYTEMFTTRTRK